MIERCREAGLPEPEFRLTDGFVIVIRRKPGKAFEAVGGKVAEQVTPHVAPHVTPQVSHQVRNLLQSLTGEMTRAEMMEALGLKDRMHFSREYLQAALDAGFIEMTIPEKPRSSRQKYRLTEKGKRVFSQDF